MWDYDIAAAGYSLCAVRLKNRTAHGESLPLAKRTVCYSVSLSILRHSSTTYKLKLNHGDLKATQGDTGHAEVDMITRIYAHILDEDRKINAQKFESSFYSNPDLRNVRAPADPQPTIVVALLIQQLQNSPELANTLAALLPRT